MSGVADWDEPEMRAAAATVAVVGVLAGCRLVGLSALVTTCALVLVLLLGAPVLERGLALLPSVAAWASLDGFVAHRNAELSLGVADLALLALFLVAGQSPRPSRLRARQTVAMFAASSISRRRRRYAYLLAVVGLPSLTGSLLPLRDVVSLATCLLPFLVLVVVVAVVGGRGPSLVCALVSSLLLNFFFTPPFHTWVIRDPENAVTIGVFLLVAGLVGWVVDLAARHAQQAAEQSARAEVLEAATRFRTALLVALGHDLRTPLAVAKAGVSGARSSQLDLPVEDRTELLASAEGALDQLAGLMEGLLDLSRLQTGALAMHRRPVPVDAVLANALDVAGVAPRAVLVDVDEELPLVLADPELLERVLANLVANAQRFAPASIPPTVVARRVGTQVEVRVIDRGPGIRPEDRVRVFEPFQRLGDTDNTTGLGLGLALARGLTEAMGGTIRAEDTTLGGLTMVVSLEVAGEEP